MGTGHWFCQKVIIFSSEKSDYYLDEMCIKMKLFVVLCLIAMVIAKESKPKKLQIGIKKRVENCTVKSKRGDLLHMHYTGTLEDGTEFDSSIPRGQPLTFTLGSGQVIRGWDQGLMGMCEQRRGNWSFHLIWDMVLRVLPQRFLVMPHLFSMSS